MKLFKKLKLLKVLFNKEFVFYRSGGRWHFETEIKNNDEIQLIREYIDDLHRKDISKRNRVVTK